jgi:hypothetical protein
MPGRSRHGSATDAQARATAKTAEPRQCGRPGGCEDRSRGNSPDARPSAAMRQPGQANGTTLIQWMLMGRPKMAATCSIASEGEKHLMSPGSVLSRSE